VGGSTSRPHGRESSSSIHRAGPVTVADPFAASTSDYDMTSPTSLYHNPSHASSGTNPGTGMAYDDFRPQPHFSHFSLSGFNPSAVPHLDRQMVFGAYAGIDPSSMSNLQNAPENPWDALDMFSGWTDPPPQGQTQGHGHGHAHSHSQPQFPTQGELVHPSQMLNIGVGGTGTAFMMPFNIDPPMYGSSGSGNGELASDALDGMDFGEMGVGVGIGGVGGIDDVAVVEAEDVGGMEAS
jgi:hypothetical protein